MLFDSIMSGKPLKNVDLAKQWDCSEGKVRKVRASVLKKLRLGKVQRVRHHDEKVTRQHRQAHQARLKAGKRGVKDQVWWDKKMDGNPL